MARSLVAAAACAFALLGAQQLPAQDGTESKPGDDLRPRLEEALRRYFAAERPQGQPLSDVLAVAKGREDLLVDVIRTKSFVGPKEAAARSGVIDSRERFRDLGAAGPAPGGQPVGAASGNAALFYGPAASAKLAPFVVFVPDTTSTFGWIDRLRTEAEAGRFVFLVPDEKGDNRWNPTQRERRRHVGPLRDFLLECPIDPDRLYLVGTGRGGHFSEQGEALPGVPKLRTRSLGWVLSAPHVRHGLHQPVTREMWVKLRAKAGGPASSALERR